MNILILGATGFIGTNLTIQLAKDKNNKITLVDRNRLYFKNIEHFNFENVKIVEDKFSENMNFDEILKNQEIVYHLVSTVVPSTSNQHISQDIQSNVLFSSKLFEACVKNDIKKVIFISSGGTVYGKEANCPLCEDTHTNPISSYGLQKVMIEQLLYLYNYMYGLDYRIIRLANPYGPYQRPNGVLGAVTTFIYKALKGEEIIVYGDGSIVRDFIYIDDAIKAILTIANNDNKYRIFNVGSGCGTSIKQLIKEIEKTLSLEINVIYKEGRDVDVPINYLDISRYEKYYGKLNLVNLHNGILKTADFMTKFYEL